MSKETFTVVDKRQAEGTETHVGTAAPAAPAPAKPTRSPADVEAAFAFHYAEDRTVATVHEVYAHGFPLWCFIDGKPNTALVRPIRRPDVSEGGIIVATDAKRGTLGTNAIAYLVLALGDEVGMADDCLRVSPGDVVILRNAMLEPLDDTLNTLSIGRMHILSKVAVTGF